MAAPSKPAGADSTPGHRPGVVTLILGCMFSGKTTELLRRLRHRRSGEVHVFKHVLDHRYRIDAIVTHTGDSCAARRVGQGREILLAPLRARSVVGVDEAHFFDDSLEETVRELAKAGHDTMLTSLDVDSWAKAFPLIERLRRVADEVVALTAQCARCGAVADRTQRLAPIVSGEMIGGPESFEARCRVCWRPPPVAASQAICPA